MNFEDQSDEDHDMWAVIEITGETTLKYKIRWDGLDPATGKPWPQDWIPKKDVTSDLVDAWRAKGNKEKGRRNSSSPDWTGTAKPRNRRRSAKKKDMIEDEEDGNDRVISVRKGSWKDHITSSSSKTTQRSASSSLPPAPNARGHRSRSPTTTKTNSTSSKSHQATSCASTSSTTVQRKRKRPSISEDELDLLPKRRKVNTSTNSLSATSLAQGEPTPGNSRPVPELEQRTPDPLFLESDSPEPERELGLWPQPETPTPVTSERGLESIKDTLPSPGISRTALVRAMTEGLSAVGMHVVVGLDRGREVYEPLQDARETRRDEEAMDGRALNRNTHSSATSGLPNSQGASTDDAGTTGKEMAEEDETLDANEAPFLELQDVETDDEQGYLIHFDATKSDHTSPSRDRPKATSISTSETTARDEEQRSSAVDIGSEEDVGDEAGERQEEEVSTKGSEKGRCMSRESEHEIDKILDMELQYPDDDELDDVHERQDPASSTADQTIRDLQRQLSEKCAELAQKDTQISILQKHTCTDAPSPSSTLSPTVLQSSGGLTAFLEQRIAWLEDDAKRWRQAAEFIIRKDELKADEEQRELDRVKGELAEMKARAEEAERVLASMREEEERRLGSTG